MALGRPAEEVHVGVILRQFETRLPFAECFDERQNTCPLVDACRLRPALAAAIEAFYDALVPVTLHDLVAGNHCLADLLHHADSRILPVTCPGPEAKPPRLPHHA